MELMCGFNPEVSENIIQRRNEIWSPGEDSEIRPVDKVDYSTHEADCIDNIDKTVKFTIANNIDKVFNFLGSIILREENVSSAFQKYKKSSTTTKSQNIKEYPNLLPTLNGNIAWKEDLLI